MQPSVQHDYGVKKFLKIVQSLIFGWLVLVVSLAALPASATPFTTVSPDGTVLPTAYPQAGGVALILYGANGNIYYQFSDPAGAFTGFQFRGQPARFRGNPFVINDPLTLDCGLQSCNDYFDGAIVKMEVRFTAQDGDTAAGNFDEDEIFLLINGVNIGNWSDIPTENTNLSGTQRISGQLGFGNRTFDTGWFATTNTTLLDDILTSESIRTEVLDNSPDDNRWNFRLGNSLANPGLARVAPAYTLDKRARSGSFSGPETAAFGAVGETIYYTYDVRNVGSVRIDNLQVQDDRLGTITCTPTSIAIGATATCRESHQVTQAEFDAQNITNEAQATGQPEFGQLGTLSDTATVTGPGRNPAIRIVKTPDGGTYSARGDTINYQFVVTNTGDVTLSNVNVTDPLIPGLSCARASLGPTQRLTCSASYSVTQDDVDNGTINNTANVTSRDPVGTATNNSDTATNTALQNPAYSVLKSTTSVPTAAGQTLAYEFAVRNDGNVSIRNVTPTDAKCAGAISLTSGDVDNDLELDVGNTHIYSCTSIAITQDEIDAGQIDNTVSVTGNPAGGVLGTITDPLSTPVTRTSIFDVAKSTTSTPTAAGQTLSYRFEVNNTGNASISAITIADAKCGLSLGLISGDTDNDTELDPSETWIYTCTSIAVTQDEVDDGTVDNTVNLSGTAAGGGTVTGVDTLQTPVPPAPSFTITKSTTGTPSRAGDRLNYSFAVFNNGNVTIAGVVLDDPKCATAFTLASGDTDNDGALDVGETHNFTCQSIPVTQAEVDAGQVDNTVTANGTPAGGVLAQQSDSDSTTITPAPALTMDKRLNAASPTTFDDGTAPDADELIYDFVVTNSGNVTLAGPVTINDVSLDALASCPAVPSGGLRPNQSITCTGRHTITQADVDAGFFNNTASASSNGTTSLFDSVMTPGDQNPALDMVKTGNLPASFAPNQPINYQYLVTNTGNTTILDSATISVVDNRIVAPNAVSCPPVPGGGLAPTASLTCSATYTITNEDAQIGSVTNTATATDGNVTSPVASETIPNNATPALSLTKTAVTPGANITQVGDLISYSYFVQNTGGAPFAAKITVSDNKINNGVPFDCWLPTAGNPTLDPDPAGPGGNPPVNTNGESFTCFADYPVTQDDVDAGIVENEAVAETIYAPGGAMVPVASPPSNATVAIALSPSMTVAKTAAPADLTTVAPGSLITYTFVLENTGEVTLDDATPIDSGPTFGGQPASNALSPFTVTVGPDGNTDGRVDTLAPTATATVTATYTLTQADIDNAAAAADPSVAIANSASATAAPRQGTLGAVAPSAATTGFTPEPAFVATKGTASTPEEAGDTLDYTFFVENTGNVSISNVALIDPKCAATPALQAGDLNNNLILDVDETFRFTCTSIPITQDEVDDGMVENTVTVSGTPTGGNLVDITADNTTEIDAESALDVAKSTTSTPTAAGQTLDYTFVVTNLGNVSITPGVLDDVKCAAAPVLQSGDANNDDDINPNETWTYTCTSIPVTQAEVNAGTVDNTVTVPGTTPGGDPIDPPSDTVKTPVIADPVYSVLKATTDVPTTEGQTLNYTFTVNNDGNVSVGNLIVSDDKCAAPPTLQSGDANTNTVLDPPETWIYSCTSIPVTQAEIDAGRVDNTVRVTGNQPNGTPLPPTSNTLMTPVDVTPSFTLNKSTASTPTAAGDTLEYAFVLTNTGNTSISAISIADGKCAAAPALDPTSDAGGDTVLSPAEVWNFTCTSIPVTQAEADAGQVINNATATGTPTGGTLAPAPANTNTNIASTPGLAMSKGTTSTPTEAGQTLNYFFRVTNTGNTSLSTVAITDAKCAAAPVLQSGDANNDDDLNPTETWTFTCRSVPVTQAEVDAGEVLNEATVNATDPGGDPSPPATARNETEIPEAGGFSVEKSTTSVPQRANDTLDYTFTLTNNGNVSVENIVVTDAKCAAAPALRSGDRNGDAALNPTETWVYICNSIPVTQAEVDAGLVRNDVSVAGNLPGGDPLPPATANETVGITPVPGIEATKTITSTATMVDETVIFRIEVRNTGNVTLRSVTVDDTLTRADGTPLTLSNAVGFASANRGSSAGTLLPNETAVYTASYVLTQADIDGGGLSNTATAMGSPPLGAPVSDISDDGIPANGDNNPTVLIILAEPELALVKSLAAVVKADGSTVASYDAVGDRLDYLFVVTNTGNVTITDDVSITDPLITDANGTIACDPVPLAPGDMLECRGSYVIVQEDINTGQVDNTATASDGTTTSPPSETTTEAVQNPGLTTTKDARPVPSAQFFVGAIVTYDYVTTNTGNLTITAPITITDNLIDPSNINCDPWPGTLEPGENYACVGTYTVTLDDFDLDVVTNLAFGTSGTTSSPQVSESVPEGASPALTIVKSTTDTSFDAVGDVLNYSFNLTNSGEQTFVRPIRIVDDRIGTFICWRPAPGNLNFRVGEATTCTRTYRVTQADLDAGFVTNQAFAQTRFRRDTTVVSAPDSVTINAELIPMMALDKTAALPAGRTTETLVAGDVLTYTLAVTNTGNQTLRNISISDTRLSLTCTIATLDPTDPTNNSCRGAYTILQSDIDAGQIVNDASATGADPQGGAVSANDRLTTPLPTPRSTISINKTSNVSSFGDVGSTIVYGFEVENTGNVTLRNVSVTDPLIPGFACSIARLLPQEVSTTCSAVYTVVQADVDAGTLTNTASATGSNPAGDPVTDNGQVTTPGPAAAGALEATKTLSFDGTTEGSTVTFFVTVANAGNVTLSDVVPVDMLTRLDGTSLALNAPGLRFAGGDDDRDGDLDVSERWLYTGTYNLVQDDINEGGLSNIVDVTARDPAGNLVSDRADDGDDADGNTEDDPTVFDIVIGPLLEATKTISTTGAIAGDTLVFDIALRNLGNVDLQNVTINDQLNRADGTALTLDSAPTFVSGDSNNDTILNLPETWRYQASYTLTQADVDAGGIRNVVTAFASDDSGVDVQDTSDNGNDTDGNTTSDPTALTIPATPSMAVRKSVQTAATEVDEIVTFLIEVENTGSVTLSETALQDTLTRVDGTALALTSGLTFSNASAGSAEGAILPDGVLQYTATYQITQEDLDAGGISNTVVATATTPAGPIVSDTSDDPDAPGTGPSDPTVLSFERAPSLVVEKSVTAERVLFPTVFEVTFEITVENDGNTTLTDLSVSDDLAAFAAPALILNTDFPTTVAVVGLTSGDANEGFDGVADTQLLGAGATLVPGATATISVTTTYGAATGYPAPGENTANATSSELPEPVPGIVTSTNVDSDGDGVPDGIESLTDDRDGDGIPDAEDYDPTGYFYCEENGGILSGGQITVSGNGFSQTGAGTSGPITIVRDGSTGEYQFFVTRAGTFTLSYSGPSEGTPSDQITATTVPTDVGNLRDVISGTRDTNPRILGSSEFGATRSLADSAPAANPAFYTTFVIEAGDPAIFSNNIPYQACAVAGDLVATKTVIGRSDVRLGDLVTYQLGFELSGEANTLRNLTFTDLLPVGISYVPGSGRITRDGGAVVALDPVRSGRRLSWTGETLSSGTRTLITISGRVGPNAPTGNLTNQTYVQGTNGTLLSNIAEAVVRRVPEHVFDCSDVIGKVFDDRNRNGYQDELTAPVGVTDQTYLGGKGKVATAPAEPEPEPGLPGVRIATVNGTLITSDKFGRFHVPCAELPAKAGTNFILKVDERSLPSGYRMTTENPRVVRLTAGKFAKMNFGASLGRVIAINLSGAAFVQGAEPSDKLRDAVRNLSKTLRSEPSVVRLTYVAATDGEVKTGRARMRAVEQLLKREWRRNGTYKLTIEKTIKRGRGE